MSAIFGCVCSDGAAPQLALMQPSMADWGRDGLQLCQQGTAGFALALTHNTPQAHFETLPRWLETQQLLFCAAARLDNREDLCRVLNIAPAEREHMADGELALRAYLRWGENCPQHLLGDWALAAWQQREQRLFLARDHMGNTALYFSQALTGGGFAFAATPTALHALGVPRRLNELYLARRLTSLHADRDLQTIALDVQRLAPAHALTLSPSGLRSWCYWRPEDIVEHRNARPDDACAGMLELYTQAVASRCRSARPVASTLSGGLDSGSVTALAARHLAARGLRLGAFTQIPLYDTRAVLGPRMFGDEREFAQCTAAGLPNVDHQLLPSAHVSPMEGLLRLLKLLDQPAHAANNFFWLHDLLHTAQTQGYGVLLTGQGGNGGISWPGAPELASLPAVWRAAGWKAALRRQLPRTLLRRVLLLRSGQRDWSHTAISPDFARRVGLAEQEALSIGTCEPAEAGWRTPRDKHLALVRQMRLGMVGETWASCGAAYALDIRDPTLDVRVLEYTLALPDTLFYNAAGGNRLLIRGATHGILPERVRLNSKVGCQAADLAYRLQSCAAQVEAALATAAIGPAGDYVHLDRMRAVWQAVREHPEAPGNTQRAVSILLRGLMAALWLNRVYDGTA